MPKRGEKHHCATVSDEQLIQAVKDYLAGKPAKEIAAELSVPYRTVTGWMAGSRKHPEVLALLAAKPPYTRRNRVCLRTTSNDSC